MCTKNLLVKVSCSTHSHLTEHVKRDVNNNIYSVMYSHVVKCKYTGFSQEVTYIYIYIYIYIYTERERERENYDCSKKEKKYGISQVINEIEKFTSMFTHRYQFLSFVQRMFSANSRVHKFSLRHVSATCGSFQNFPFYFYFVLFLFYYQSIARLLFHLVYIFQQNSHVGIFSIGKIMQSIFQILTNSL